VTEAVPKPARVIIGILLMAAFVMVAMALVLRYAGSWGVPYFGFTTERGSACTNTFTGYTCEKLTLADLEFYGDVDLPADTIVVEARYESTHDFSLDALVEIPKNSAKVAQRRLVEAYGACKPGRPFPRPVPELTAACVMTNEDATAAPGEASSTLFTVGTGLRKDGVRVVALSVESR
jgi:hypothetical protein